MNGLRSVTPVPPPPADPASGDPAVGTLQADPRWPPGLRVFHVTALYPSAERPDWGVFVRSQISSLPSAGVDTVGIYEIEGWRTGLNYARALVRLPALVEAADPDVVHVHDGLSAVAAMGLRRRALVVSFCGSDLLGHPDAGGRTPRTSALMARLRRLAARRAHAVIVKSAAMRRVLADRPGTEVIPNGVDLTLFRPVPRDQARGRLGWRLPGLVLLFAADPRNPRKNYPCASAAAAILRARGLDVRLECLHGHPPESVALAMNAADVLLHPSYQEGSANVVKEALAVNLPVVSADVGDGRERLAGVWPSAVVERTPAAFAEAARSLLAAGRRSNGRQAVASLSLEATAQRVRAVYQTALRRFRADSTRQR